MCFPKIEAPFRPLHAGDGGEILRYSAGAVSQGCRRTCWRHRVRTKQRRFVMQSAGRNIPKACRSFALRRSCNCCLGISDGLAAAFWRCAVTPRSKARPIFRRSMTFCLVIWRCRAAVREETLQRYLDTNTNKTGLWSNYPAYFVSLLKAYYGKNATAENDFGYDWLPKITANHSFFEYLYDMADGKMEGMFLIGQNSAVGCAELAFSTEVAGEIKMACRSRHGGDRAGQILARLCGN